MHYVHPPGCGHTLYTVGVKYHYESLANFISCLLAELYWYRSKSTLRTMWLHHMMLFVHPPGCGHTMDTVREKNHHKSLANLVNCLLVVFHWYRSKSSLRIMWLQCKMHFVHPPGCRHTLYTVGVRNHYESLANLISCLSAKFHWYRSRLTLTTIWLHQDPLGCTIFIFETVEHTLWRPIVGQMHIELFTMYYIIFSV